MPAYCPSCWNEINPGDDSCPHCSYRMRDYDGLSYEMKLLYALDHPIRETRMMAIQLLGELKSTAALPAFRSILRAEDDVYIIREIARSLAALPFFGASIPGFVGLLTGRGPFSPAFALIPGRSSLACIGNDESRALLANLK